MQLDSSLGAPLMSPIEDRGAEFNQGGVERQQHAFETKAMQPRQRSYSQLAVDRTHFDKTANAVAGWRKPG